MQRVESKLELLQELSAKIARIEEALQQLQAQRNRPLGARNAPKASRFELFCSKTPPFFAVFEVVVTVPRPVLLPTRAAHAGPRAQRERGGAVAAEPGAATAEDHAGGAERLDVEPLRLCRGCL